jgi:hypothetical protein
MKAPRPAITSSRRLGLALAVALMAGCWGAEDRAFYRAVGSLSLGTAERDVVGRLGPPSDTGTEFRLGQREGFEAEYKAAAESGSRRYLFWNRSIDVVCAVGLDAQDRVAYRGRGGT